MKPPSDSNSPIEKIIMTGLGSGWAEQSTTAQRSVTIFYRKQPGLVFSFMTITAAPAGGGLTILQDPVALLILGHLIGGIVSLVQIQFPL